MKNTDNTFAAALLSAFARETEAAGNKRALSAEIKMQGLWTIAALQAEESPMETAAAAKEAAGSIAAAITAAAAGGASQYYVDGVLFNIARDTKGNDKPISKQPPYMRFSDLAGMFAAVAELPAAYASGIFRTNTEAAALVGERAFKVALSAARQQASLAALSPIRRLWSEVELLEAAEIEAVAAIEKAAAALELAESAAAAARSRKLDREAVAMEGEAAAAAAVGSNGKDQPAALKEAREAAAAAAADAAGWQATADAAEAAAAGKVASAAATAAGKRKAAAAV